MMYNEPHAVRCTRARVYKDKGRLYIDYWGIDEDNPKVEIHIPKMSLDLKSIQFNTDSIKNWYTGTVISSREIMVSSDKDEYFEVLVKDERKKQKISMMLSQQYMGIGFQNESQVSLFIFAFVVLFVVMTTAILELSILHQVRIGSGNGSTKTLEYR